MQANAITVMKRNAVWYRPTIKDASGAIVWAADVVVEKRLQANTLAQAVLESGLLGAKLAA